ncbi:MAG TPA: DNA polymerase III subunit alpha, partial [Bacteroidales bacterium]|nr:DNA polymerase III subunit alpha [Bacteroidales bacterium]
AAGSVVAYCTKITDVDPIEFNLLFERFLNPDRISMPDVDIDFDDDGRALVIDYVTEKYGQDKVAHICTIGTMKAKGALRDVSRILGIPLPTVNALTKKIPTLGSLSNAYEIILETEQKTGSIDKAIANIEKDYKIALSEDNDKEVNILNTRLIIAQEIKNARETNDEKLLKAIAIACTLEGAVRQTGVHACGILIGKNDLENHIPLMRAKDDSKLYATQYEGSYVESIGLLKMDFLGLRTLSIIKETLKNIEISRKEKISVDNLPLDDKKTLEIFKTGATTSIFQFESEGMKSHLRALKPNHFNDLVAMNALYRPGPMEYIKDYIDRKHGIQKTEYDHPIMEKFLKDTYGITVFQEQVMLQARALAGFTRGESDSLRKAMGKKLSAEMENYHQKFTEGCKNNPKFIEGCISVKKDPDELIDKIWKDWANFAKYAFNKSHSVCYAHIAFQTAYLKAHYPAEFMAANLTRNMSEIDKITTQMEECKRMKIKVLGPDVNESFNDFTVNQKGNIRFGLQGIKNVGTNAVANIIEEREKHGAYKDIFDFVSRVNLNAVNKKNIEALVHGGALDCFGELERAQYFIETNGFSNFVEELIRFGNNMQNSAPASATLFGDSFAIEVKKPEIPILPEVNIFEILKNEKEHIGMYLSGHPLDPFKFIIENLKTIPLIELENEANNAKFSNIRIAGYITDVTERLSKAGNPYGKITMIDYSSTFSFAVFGKTYTELKNYFVKGYSILMNCGFSYSTYRNDDKSTLSFNINKVHLLADLKENFFKELSLRIPVENVTPEFVSEFLKILKSSKGKVTLSLSLEDKKNKSEVTVFSRNHQIKLSDKLIEYLESNKYFNNIKLN